MPAKQKVILELHSSDGDSAARGSVPFAPPVLSTKQLYRHYAPALANFVATNEGPFNLLDYLHLHGQSIVDYLAAGFSHKQLYLLITQDPKARVAISYRFFSRNVALFRHQKGLPPSKNLPSAKPTPLAGAAHISASEKPIFPAAPLPHTSQPLELVPPAMPHSGPSLVGSTDTPVPAAASTPDPARPVSNPASGDRGNLQDILKSLFPPFTQEDAMIRKPLAQVVLDQQRAELAAYEQSLRDGTAPDW